MMQALNMSTFTAKENELVRSIVREEIAENYRGIQKWFAEAAGIKRNVISSFLSGRAGASMQTMRAIARLRNQTVEEMLAGERPPEPPPTAAIAIDKPVPEDAMKDRPNGAAFVRMMKGVMPPNIVDTLAFEVASQPRDLSVAHWEKRVKELVKMWEVIHQSAPASWQGAEEAVRKSEPKQAVGASAPTKLLAPSPDKS